MLYMASAFMDMAGAWFGTFFSTASAFLMARLYCLSSTSLKMSLYVERTEDGSSPVLCFCASAADCLSDLAPALIILPHL